MSLISIHWRSVGHTVLGIALLIVLYAVFKKTTLNTWKRIMRCLFPCCIFYCGSRSKTSRKRNYEAEGCDKNRARDLEHEIKPFDFRRALQEMMPLALPEPRLSHVERAWSGFPSKEPTPYSAPYSSSMPALFRDLSPGKEQDSQAAPQHPTQCKDQFVPQTY